MIPVISNAVSGVILRGEGDETQMLLLLRTAQDGGFWSHVCGGMEAGESAEDAWVREVKEETGLALDSLYSADFLESFYQVHKKRILLMPVFVGFVSKNAPVQLNEEHDAFVWCDVAKARERVSFPNQADLYSKIWQRFVKDRPSPQLAIPLHDLNIQNG